MSTLLKNLVWIVSILLLVLAIRIYVMAIYLVPTPSMEPTIMSQDLIVAINPNALKRKTPVRDEVWLFSKPRESNDSNLILVKRLYGTPGDTIQLVKGNITVNGVSNSKAKLLANSISAESFPYPSQKIFPNDTSILPWSALDFGPLWIPKKGMAIELSTLSILLYSRYILYESPNLSLTQNGIITNGGNELTEYTFTTNYYFACGDNLAFSTDSRHWGLVPESHLISKANRIILPTYKPFANIKRVLKPIE
jgi:signal peptidase I